MRERKKARILLTNDDGILAEGLYALYQGLRDVAELIVVAPRGERSACSHSITLSDPLKIETINRDGQFYGYGISGTPVDCVKLAVSAILESGPDMVISGINWGLNTGVHILYSGTVSAAAEAAMLGIPAMAVSLAPVDPAHFTPCAQFVRKLALTVLEQGLPSGTLLNINVPSFKGDQVPEVAITKQARCSLRDCFHRRTDPRNNVYYWLANEEMIPEEEEGGDVETVLQGKISITPIRLDLTDHQFMDELRAWPILDLGKK